MRHIKLENNMPVNYTLEQLFIDVPDAVIYKNSQMPHPELLSNYNVYPLVTTPQPSLNEDETVEEGTPEFKDNEWQQTWIIRKLSTDEIQEIIDSRQSVVTDTNGSSIINSVKEDKIWQFHQDKD